MAAAAPVGNASSMGRWYRKLFCGWKCPSPRDDFERSIEVEVDRPGENEDKWRSVVDTWRRKLIERRERWREEVEVLNEPLKVSFEECRPSTSKDVDAPTDEPVDLVEIKIDKKPLKSTLRKSTSSKSMVSVRFDLPSPDACENGVTQAESESEKNDRLEKWREICTKPICRLIICIVFGVVFPAFLVYPGLYYLYPRSEGRISRGQD